MIRIRSRRPEAPPRPRRRWAISLLRRAKAAPGGIYCKAAEVIKSRRSAEALAWVWAHLRPEAARMLETCLSTYGPTEALRWISYWEEKQEPIAKNPDAAGDADISLH